MVVTATKLIKLASASGAVMAIHRLAYRAKRARTMSHLEERLWGVTVPMAAATWLATDGETDGIEAIIAAWMMFAAAGMGYLMLQHEDETHYKTGLAALEVERQFGSNNGGEGGARANQ